MIIIKVVPISLFLFTCISIVIILNFRKNKNVDIYFHNKIFTVIYLNLCIAVYFLLKPYFLSLFDQSVDYILIQSSSKVLVLLSVNIISLTIIITFIKNIFYSIVISSFIYLLFCVTLMIFVGFGVINVVWTLIFTGIFCGFLLAQYLFDDIKRQLNLIQKSSTYDKRKDYLESVRKEADKYLKIAVQAYLALAASIGVSMSILFKEGEIAWKKYDYQSAATIMVFAFLLVSAGALFIIAKPYLDITIKLSEIQRKLYLENNVVKYPRKSSA